MSKKVIECEYCHTLISEEDVKCPECGANCSNVIKKYRKEQEEQQKKEKDEAIKQTQEVFNNFNKTSKPIFIIAGLLIVIIPIFAISQMISNRDRFNDTLKNNKLNEDKAPTEKEENKKIKIGYQETGELDDLKVTLDSYELYEYYSKDFERYNTPKGYQKIAFHFELENTSEENSKYLYSFVDLTADDTPVESTKLEVTKGFDSVKTGKEKYETLDGQTLRAGQTLKGYIGFLVPTDKKVLKFLIGNITIEMDNPAYKG